MRSRILRDGSWLLIGQLASAAALILGLRLLTEIVSTSAYGDAALLIGAGVFAYNLFAYPYSQAALRLYPDATVVGRAADLYEAIWTELRWPTAILIAIFIAVGGALQAAHRAHLLSFVAAAAVFVADSVRTLQQSFYNASGRQRVYSIWSAADAWARPLGAFAIVELFGASSTAIVVGYAVATAAIVPLFHSRLGASSNSAGARSELRIQARKYALPLMPLAITAWISTFSDRYIIGALLHPADVGIYVATYGLASRPFTIWNTVLLGLFRPIYFARIAERNRAGANRLLMRWFATSVVTLVGGALLLYVLRGFLVRLALSAAFRSGVELIMPIAIGHVFLCFAQTANIVSLGHLRPGLTTAAEVSGAITSFVAIPMIVRFGIAGAAWSVPIYYGVQLVVAVALATYAGSRRETT